MFTSPTPPQHKQTLFGHKYSLRGLTDPKTVMEKYFQGPMFTRPPPFPPQHKRTLGGHTHPCFPYMKNHTEALCDTNEKQLSGPHVNKGSPLIGRSHRTTLWADKTATYTQHRKHLCDTNRKQLSGPHVNKGFPYIKE